MSADDGRVRRQARNEQLRQLRSLRAAVRLGEDVHQPLDDRLITIDEACDALQISRRTLYRRLDEVGGLNRHIIAGRGYVVYDELVGFVDRYEQMQRAKVDDAVRTAKARLKTKRKTKSAA